MSLSRFLAGRGGAVLCLSIAVMMITTLGAAMTRPSAHDDNVTSRELANGSRTFTVGLVGYLTNVATLNPFQYTQSDERMTIWPCYSTLLTYDAKGSLIGDLATAWRVTPNGTIWNFKLVNNAYFVDPANPTTKTHQVTASDVIWTLWQCNNNSGSSLGRYLTYNGAGVIVRMWTGSDQFDLYIQTIVPYAPFIGSMASIPILPKYIWTNLGPYQPLTYPNLPPIGSGPFYYGEGSMLPGQLGILKRNPIWFQEADRGWEIHVDALQFKEEFTTAGAWTDLTGNPPGADVFIGVTPSQYLANIVNTSTPNVIGWAQDSGFIYEYQLNQLDSSRRAQYQAAGLIRTGGQNNQLLLNATVKEALAMCVDKQAFINSILNGLGSTADSLVPACNPWHFAYPNPVKFDPAAARALLNNAGWSYDSTGAYNPEATPLYKRGASNGTLYQPLSFRLATLNTDVTWVTASALLAQWASQAGIQFSLYLLGVNQMSTTWSAGNYDAWLWDRAFSPASDPSTDCLRVMTTMAIGSGSGSFWHNASFDSLYNNSLTTTDSIARRTTTNALQASVYDDHATQLIAYAKSLYAASTVRWTAAGYGNWSKYWALAPDAALPWLYTRLSPVDNLAPTVSVSQSNGYDGFMNAPISFSGSSSQTTNIQYQWYWGDGSTSGWLSSPSTTHVYTRDGMYIAYFAARQTTGADLFSGWNQTTVTIVDSNLPPVFGATPITMTPSTGISTATNVTFTGSATDPDGDPIYWSWDFGDGYIGQGPVVSHRFNIAGFYTVKLAITDNPIGGIPQVATHAVIVTENQPPQLSLPLGKVVLTNTATTFAATASDPDGDPLRFTWDWGDGTMSVTMTPSAVHMYQTQGTRTLVVHADDLTGLAGHNVSASELLRVINGPPTPPFAVQISADNYSIWAGQSVTFTGSAQDPAGDAMQFTFAFGDGNSTVVNNAATSPNQVVTDVVTHMYMNAGTMTATLAASDGLVLTTSTPVTITVTLNHPPILTPQPNRKMWQGNISAFSATATDLDGEAIRYTWNFGDGGPLVVARTTTHAYASAGYYNFTVYADDLTGLPGHNVSSRAQAQVAFNLPLVQGWNIISLPLVGYGYKSSTLGLATGDVVIQWNPATQSYNGQYIMGISPPSQAFPILPSTGYWVWVAASKTLHLYGAAPTGLQTRAVTLPAGGGWILMGMASLRTWHASDIPTIYSPGHATLVVIYQPPFHTYKAYIPSVPGSDFSTVPGVGFWVFATGSGTFSYMP